MGPATKTMKCGAMSLSASAAGKLERVASREHVTCNCIWRQQKQQQQQQHRQQQHVPATAIAIAMAIWQ